MTGHVREGSASGGFPPVSVAPQRRLSPCSCTSGAWFRRLHNGRITARARIPAGESPRSLEHRRLPRSPSACRHPRGACSRACLRRIEEMEATRKAGAGGASRWTSPNRGTVFPRRSETRGGSPPPPAGAREPGPTRFLAHPVLYGCGAGCRREHGTRRYGRTGVARARDKALAIARRVLWRSRARK
jgi:hypothetical protein